MLVILPLGLGEVAQRSHAASCIVLVADYNDSDGVMEIARLVNKACIVHVVAKGGAAGEKCKPYPNLECEERANVGREFGTISTWIADNYDLLPEVLILCPSSLGVHNRRARLRKLLDGLNSGIFDCAIEMSEASQIIRDRRGVPVNEPSEDDSGANGRQSGLMLRVGDVVKLEKGMYSKSSNPGKLTPAQPRGLGRWLLRHAECTEDSTLPKELRDALVCTNGIFRTTRQMLLRRSRHVYSRLSDALNVSASPEAGHYAELSARILFGEPGSRDGIQMPLKECWSGDGPNAILIICGTLAFFLVGLAGVVVGTILERRRWDSPAAARARARCAAGLEMSFRAG